MKERFKVGEQVVEAESGRRGDVVHVGRSWEVRRLPDGAVGLVGEGEGLVAWVDGDQVCVRGRVRRVSRAGQESATPPALVTPPMPGVVARVLVAVGERVVAGQGVVTVSAMKLEVTLRAPRGGVVVAVRVAPGDRVSPGDRLVDVDEE